MMWSISKHELQSSFSVQQPVISKWTECLLRVFVMPVRNLQAQDDVRRSGAWQHDPLSSPTPAQPRGTLGELDVSQRSLAWTVTPPPSTYHSLCEPVEHRQCSPAPTHTWAAQIAAALVCNPKRLASRASHHPFSRSNLLASASNNHCNSSIPVFPLVDCSPKRLDIRRNSSRISSNSNSPNTQASSSRSLLASNLLSSNLSRPGSRLNSNSKMSRRRRRRSRRCPSPRA